MDYYEIKYRFRLPDSRMLSYSIVLDPSGSNVSTDQSMTSDWSIIEEYKCAGCDFQSPDGLCPAAKIVESIEPDWQGVNSYDTIGLECIMPERTIISETTAQQAVCALIGLKLAASSCPRLRFFRPMARFHVPIYSPEEYSYQVISNYLLGKYFAGHKLDKHDENAFADLKEIFTEIESVHHKMIERMESNPKMNLNITAVVVLDILSKVISVEIDNHLSNISRLFQAHNDAA